ncbi:hypothetical protein BN12_150022 [Nostocoides japonicum T1-X7]|uniref:Uncharacterized protein n=1 Tax=Nostocoides japonicum T1-X7 TaxID=1194083 RepID=A0A077LTI3_9MICO|nr:hypothetical protein BN12_150022 [Tetrasphaera japonica T1-X7]
MRPARLGRSVRRVRVVLAGRWDVPYAFGVLDGSGRCSLRGEGLRTAGGRPGPHRLAA